MWLQLLPGAESENRRWSIIGCDEWLLNTIILRNSYLAGLSIDREPAATLRLPMNFLMLVEPHLIYKAQALYLADRASEALEAINEAVAIAERFEHGYCSAELHWLRGLFLAAMGAEESQIEVSFGEAIRIAKEQKSVSLGKRAEATYAEYRRQKASAPGARGFRLPLW
jgi:hypothetical protein